MTLMIIKKIIRWGIILATLLLATVAVDGLLLKLLWIVDGTRLMLLWYPLLLLAPISVQFFILNIFMPNRKIIIGILAIILTIITQLVIRHFLSVYIVSNQLF